MTTINIEGVLITPEIHTVLKEMQSFPECLVSVVEDATTLILEDPDENTLKTTLDVLKSLHYLKKQLTNLIPKQEGGDNESN